jgi:hypothetical protein
VRDSPSLVWGRPAKSVVERPRGFNSHIPRHSHYHYFHWMTSKTENVVNSLELGLSVLASYSVD